MTTKQVPAALTTVGGPNGSRSIGAARIAHRNTPAPTPYKWAPSPRARDILAAMQEGELCVGLAHYTELKAHGAGYLAAIPAPAGTPHYVSTRYQRTDKPCKPYAPKGPNPNYKGEFPWSAQYHWSVIEKSPMRAARAITKRLNDGQLSGSDKYLFPQYVRTQAELVTVRKVLVDLFGVPLVTSIGLNRWQHNEGWVPNHIAALLCTGVGLRLLMLDMLVEPECEGDRAVRFRTIDPESAMHEHLSIAGSGNTPLEKYFDLMKRTASWRTGDSDHG